MMPLAEQHYHRALAYTKQANYLSANTHFLEVIRLAPKHLDSYIHLITNYIQLHAYDHARHYVEKALIIAPHNLNVYLVKARILKEQLEREEAVKIYQHVLKTFPFEINALHGLAVCLHELERYEEAIAYYKQILVLSPNNREAINNIGATYQVMGNIEEAAHYFEENFRKSPEGTYYFYNFAKTTKFKQASASSYINYAYTQLNHVKTSEEHSLLHFSLSKIFDDCRDYEKAFYHATQANIYQYHKTPLHKKTEAILANHDRLFEQFDQAFFETMQINGTPSNQPIFIIGLPRCGSTLLEQMLTSHPAIDGIGEHTASLASTIALPNQSYLFPENFIHANTEFLECCADTYLKASNHANHQRETPYLINKTLSNYTIVGILQLIFPNATFIHLMRHPLDQILSMFFTKFNDPNLSFCSNLDELTKIYLYYRKTIQHWDHIFPGKIIHVSYESIVQDKQAVLSTLLEHLKLPWDDACLEHHKNQKAVQTASLWQARQPIYTSSNGKWTRYEKHLRPYQKILEHAGYLDQSAHATT